MGQLDGLHKRCWRAANRAGIFCNLLKTHAGDVDADVRGRFNIIVRDALNVSSYRTFIACASLQPDRLTLWRNYTGEVGYAVALDGNSRS